MKKTIKCAVFRVNEMVGEPILSPWKLSAALNIYISLTISGIIKKKNVST